MSGSKPRNTARPGNGGARPNSGPKPVYVPPGIRAPKTSLSLDAMSKALARAVGGGNISEGIRKSLRMACQARMIATTKQPMMLCGLCGQSWDLDSQDVPPCNEGRQIMRNELKDRK